MPILPKKRYRLVALGGTFDIIHKGHKHLLRKAFEMGERVIIGLTTDSFAEGEGKRLANSYAKRLEALRDFIEEAKLSSPYEIHPLDEHFGPSVKEGRVEALIVSEETAHRVEEANKIRSKMGKKPLEGVVIPMVMAQDGKPISSSRIRAGELDSDGMPINR